MKTTQRYNIHVRSTCKALALAAYTLGASAYSQPTDVFGPGANNNVYTLAQQPDGRILTGGQFTRLGNQSRVALARINADATLDAGFNPGNNGVVYALSVQPDGEILVGGTFTRLGGQSRSRLGRLNGDGTLDPAFNPVAGNSVYSMALQPDGNIVVGGAFTSLGGVTRRYIGRLNSDGSLDASFNPVSSGVVYSLALQPDGMILMGGPSLARLDSDGTLDGSFNPGISGTVYCLALQPDGRILVGGLFSKVGGLVRTNLARLNADGTVDGTFYLGANNAVHSIALQANGRFVVGGQFTRLGGQLRSYLGQLNADGTLDNTFNLGANNVVYALALQTDGQILAGGAFTAMAAQTVSRLALIPNTDSADDTLAFDGSNLTWQRSGAAPEVWRATFQYWTDDDGWQDLGEGVRTPGGWELDNVWVPTPATISARGFATGGWHNGSGWCIETTIGPPAIFIQPAGGTYNAGASTTLSVYAGGTGSLQYQWLKDGTNLFDGANLWGADTASLTLTGVLAPNQGDYSVVVSNDNGDAITSAVATLTVIDPCITGQPADTYANYQDDITLSVTAVGSQPINYQWRKEGTNIAEATDSFLSLTNVQPLDAGHYDVVLENPVGLVTSRVALVSVNLVLPDSFDPSADGTVQALAIQPDGKVLVGGYFSTIGGQYRTNIARLNADGTIDGAFNPGADGAPYTFQLQTDGKILVGGQFGMLGGEIRTNLARLNPDGTIDSTFDPGADNAVNCLAAQTDGKVLVGGYFTALGGQNCAGLGRLTADGTFDTNIGVSAGGWVNSLAVQADGKILVGGYFTSLGGQDCSNLGRLNPDLTVDTNFNAGADNPVACFDVQADGKILVGGDFSVLGGQSRAFLGRLNPDGTVDAGFNPGADNSVSSLALQTDGRILASGWFSTLGGLLVNGMGRLNADGSADAFFNPMPGPNVTAIALQADGSILVGGSFSTLAGQSRNNLGRLVNTDPATDNLSFDGSTITWLRGGTGPEAWGTSFDYSPDGIVWTHLGDGVRIAGGWQLAGLALPVQGTVLARASIAEGYLNASGWFVESAFGVPIILGPPDTQIAGLGEAALFGVVAAGSQPLSYQWRLNGADIVGATNSSYAISAAQPNDRASYSVLVSNAFGSVTSSPAPLLLANPVVSITHGPPDGAWLTNTLLQLDGEVTDDVPVTSVQWQLSNTNGTTDWQAASGTNDWSISVTNLALGQNTLTIQAGDAAGYFSAQVSRSYLSITPGSASLPTIDVPPQAEVGCLGHSATFAVSASGTPPLSYQWYFNTTTLLISATNASLTLSNLRATNAGEYSVSVSNPGGSTNSSPASLTVLDAYTDVQIAWFFGSYLYAGVNVAGLPGATYVLKYTPDIRNNDWATWTPLATNTMDSSGSWFYLDVPSPYSSQRFYGAKLKP